MWSYGLSAQQPAPASQPPPPPKPPAAVLLRVQIVISRHQGEKTLSNQPYTLTVTADGRGANMRTGLQMAVPISMLAEGKQTTSYSYKDVGTNIDCSAKSVDGGRFQLDISLEDSWVSADDQNG